MLQLEVFSARIELYLAIDLREILAGAPQFNGGVPFPLLSIAKPANAADDAHTASYTLALAVLAPAAGLLFRRRTRARSHCRS